MLHGHGEIEEHTLRVRALQFSATGCLVAVAGNEDVNTRTHSVCLHLLFSAVLDRVCCLHPCRSSFVSHERSFFAAKIVLLLEGAAKGGRTGLLHVGARAERNIGWNDRVTSSMGYGLVQEDLGNCYK